MQLVDWTDLCSKYLVCKSQVQLYFRLSFLPTHVISDYACPFCVRLSFRVGWADYIDCYYTYCDCTESIEVGMYAIRTVAYICICHQDIHILRYSSSSYASCFSVGHMDMISTVHSICMYVSEV